METFLRKKLYLFDYYVIIFNYNSSITTNINSKFILLNRQAEELLTGVPPHNLSDKSLPDNFYNHPNFTNTNVGYIIWMNPKLHSK